MGLKQSGTMDSDIKKWLGVLPKNEEPDTMILSVGELILVFTFIGSSVLTCLVVLLFEKVYHKFKTRNDSSTAFMNEKDGTFYTKSK